MTLMEAIRRVAAHAGKLDALRLLRVTHDQVSSVNPGGGAICTFAPEVDFEVAIDVGRIMRIAEVMVGEEVTKVKNNLRLVGAAGTFTVPVQVVDNAPKRVKIPKEWVQMPEKFLAAVGRVAYARGRDETRNHLSGVVLSEEHIFALDGHRAAVCPSPEELGELVGDVPRCTVPWEFFRGFEGELEMAMVAGSDTIYARQGDEVRWAQARQGAPDIKVLVKSLLKHPRWVIKREDLLVTVQTANLIGSRNAVMLLEIDGEHVKISCYDLEGGGAYERVVDVVRGGATEVAVVRINPQYLLKALGSSEGEEIKLGVRGPLDTVVVEDYEDYQAFISPMRD